MNLDELIDKVDSKETFLEFVEALKRDKQDEDEKEKVSLSSPYSPGINGWENGDIPGYLDAMHAFGSSSDKIKEDWKSFAWMIYAGKFYE